MPPVELLPCPFCGNDILDVGVQSAQTMGVRCPRFWMDRKTGKPIEPGCGARILLDHPDKWPRGCKRTIEALNHWTLVKAIAAWNRRIKA